MIPAIPPGYTAAIALIASTPEELGNFEPLEQTLAEFTRVIVECPVDPTEDILSIAQSVEDVCISYGIPTWPEYPDTHTFIEGNMLYITYAKASPWIQFIIPVLLVVAFLGPIILWLVSPAVREMTEMIVMIIVMFAMMWLMKKMIPTTKAPKAPEEIKEKPPPQPPLGERINARLESLGESIFKIESLYKTYPATASSQVVGAASGLASVAGAVRAAPKTAMGGYEKAGAAKKMDSLSKRLAEYEERLTPEQRVKLHREQEIVRELREMYP